MDSDMEYDTGKIEFKFQTETLTVKSLDSNVTIILTKQQALTLANLIKVKYKV